MVGTTVAVFAVAVFAVPAGIIGNGFEDLLTRRREENQDTKKGLDVTAERHESRSVAADGIITPDLSTLRGRLYAFVHAQTSSGAIFERCMFVLIFATTLTFMIETSYESNASLILAIEYFELAAVVAFSFEYVVRIYAAGEDPQYSGFYGRLLYACTFFALVDLASVLPYWIDLVSTTAHGGDPFTNTDTNAFQLFHIFIRSRGRFDGEK